MRSEIKVLANELTSPLATSRSALAMLLAGDLGELNEKQREYLGHLLKLDDYMVGLLASWVDMERLSRGEVILNIEPCNVGAIMASVASDAVASGRSSQWPMVLADPIRLKQIFMNLLEVLDVVEVRARITGDFCIVTFHDRKLKKSIKRSAIVDALHSDAPSRMLAVRIARLLAEAHGGGLELNPHASEGAKLHLKLPLAKQMSLLGDIAQ